MSTGRFAFPMEMAIVPQANRAAAAMVIDLATRATTGAELRYADDTGDYYLYTGESVTTQAAGADPVSTEITRPDYTKNAFVLSSEQGDAALRMLGNHMMGRGLSEFRRQAVTIGSGALAGEHVVQAVKCLERPEDIAPVILNVSVTRRSDGEQKLSTTADLRLVRLYDDDRGDSMITQAHRVEHDHVSGHVRSGSTIVSEYWAEVPGTYNPANDTAEQRLQADPFSLETAKNQQDRFLPGLAVNRDLTVEEWVRVLEQPIDPSYRLQHF
jgi:hypothetical protein